MSKRAPSAKPIPLPDEAGRYFRIRKSLSDNKKILHFQILRLLQDSSDGSPSLVEIYHNEVLQVRTRTIRLLGRKSTPQIIHTLLGYEVKASFKRIQCPDLVTARYLKLFTELGCQSIKLPYDPTVTAGLVPHLESSMDRLTTGVKELFPKNRDLRLYVLQRLYRHVRNQLRSA